MKRFKLVAVGGTFDELHKGHEALLSKAFEIGGFILIGLSTNDLVSRMGKPYQASPYEERMKALNELLRSRGWLERSEVIPLNDPYGAALFDERIEALVVSRETEPRAHEINEGRRARGLHPLDVVVVEMVLAEDGLPISTRRIKRGEIDREGKRSR